MESRYKFQYQSSLDKDPHTEQFSMPTSKCRVIYVRGKIKIERIIQFPNELNEQTQLL